LTQGPVRLTDDPLAWLIGRQADGFIANAYEREAVVAHHGEPARFADLLSIADIDRFVAELDFQRGMLMLANASRRVEEREFVSSSGAIDRAAVARLYAEGATIILNQLQESDGRLARLCRSLETVFSCHVQTNTYLTPPSNQGFHTHFDNHDVFVIQIEGEKTWRLYDQPVAAPYRGEPFQPGTYPVGEPVQTFVLRAGDCAYVPRGFMHDAATSGDRPSLHITCGLIVRTWADLVLEAVSQVCVGDPAFRRSLPPGFASPAFDRSALVTDFSSLMRRLAESATPQHALDLAIDEFIGSRLPDISGAIIGAHEPLSVAYVARPSLWRIEEDDGGGVQLSAPAGDLVFPGVSRADLERILSGDPFTTASVAAGDGESLIRRLVAAGLIAAAQA
jgi:hypothetical protein